MKHFISDFAHTDYIENRDCKWWVVMNRGCVAMMCDARIYSYWVDQRSCKEENVNETYEKDDLWDLFNLSVISKVVK